MFPLTMNLQIFADSEPGGDVSTFEINGQQMTAEQIAESYKKLQGEFTKVTQKNSELNKEYEKAKPWLEFDKTLDDLSAKTGQQLKPQVGMMIDSLINGLANGKAPTETQMSQLGKAIDKAEAKGDDELAQRLQALESTAMEVHYEKAIVEIENTAKSDGIEFDRKEFEGFFDQWLDDLGLEEFDNKHLKKAYQAYEAQKIKESAKKGNIPPLGTSGGAAGPDKSNSQPTKVGGLKGAAARARELLSK